jgi:RNA polymerase sigma-70 factor (ECF subfamily)
MMELKMDDMQAIRRLKGGEIGGLEFLVARYQIKAVEIAFLITQDEALAEDAVQDVFVQIYRRIGRFDENRPFKPYLMRSVVNAALDAVEKRAKWVGISSGEEAGELGEMISQAASVEDQVEFAQLVQEIESALADLPARQRAAIVQRYYLEMSEKEMAEALNAAPGTIKWLLNAARARLRILLGSERSAE